MAKLIIGMIVCTVVVIIVLAGVDSFTGGFVNNSNSSEYVDDVNTLEVSVLGEVNKTGTYLLPLDSTLADLLDAAGKVTGNADPKAYDTSVILEDKDSFYIAPLFDQNDVCATEPIRKVCTTPLVRANFLTSSALSATALAKRLSITGTRMGLTPNLKTFTTSLESVRRPLKNAKTSSPYGNRRALPIIISAFLLFARGSGCLSSPEPFFNRSRAVGPFSLLFCL